MIIDAWFDEYVHLSGSDGEYTMQFHHLGKTETGEEKMMLCKVVYPSTLKHALRLFVEYSRAEADIGKTSVKNAKEIMEALTAIDLKLENFCRNFFRECEFQGKKDFTLKNEYKHEKFTVTLGAKDVKKK